jgi:uncharacterized protein involved in copper resistance
VLTEHSTKYEDFASGDPKAIESIDSMKQGSRPLDAVVESDTSQRTVESQTKQQYPQSATPEQVASIESAASTQQPGPVKHRDGRVSMTLRHRIELGFSTGSDENSEKKDDAKPDELVRNGIK